MTNTIFTDLDTVNHLKRRAKELKKSTGKLHTECLEIVAIEAGWPNWKAVAQACEPYKRALSEWNDGIVVIFEHKDTDSVNTEKLQQNDLAFEIGFPVLRANVDEDRVLSEEEFWEEFEGEWFVTYSLLVDAIPSKPDVDWLHEELKDAAFFMPLAVFWKGKPVFEASRILCDKENPLPDMYYW